MSGTKLKPCPFCGAPAVIHTAYHSLTRDYYTAYCTVCGASIKRGIDTCISPAKAVAAWNRRATEAQTSGALEDAVRDMRAAQREYFRTRESSALTAAKQAERAVDALLTKIDEDKANAGKPRQGELL